MGDGYIHRTVYRPPRPVYRFLAAALAECLLFCGLAGFSPAAGTSLAPF